MDYTRREALLGTLVLGVASMMCESAQATELMSLDDALARRRSVRVFQDKPLTSQQLNKLCWAAQGVTDTEGKRTAPSAGALYPLELFVASSSGVERYLPNGDRRVSLLSVDKRKSLQQAAMEQAAIGRAPVVFVMSAVVSRSSRKYGERARRYVFMEAGHAAQNLLLQAVALGLGAVPIGAFDDEAVRRAIPLPAAHEVLYLLPVGWPVAS